MKKELMSFCLTIAVLLTSMTVKCQYQFSVTELQGLCKSNVSDFETVALRKGFSYEPTVSNKTSKSYFSDYTYPGGAKNTLTYISEENKPIKVIFGTMDKQFYLERKDELSKENGWTFVKEETTQNNGNQYTTYYYTSKDYSVELAIYYESQTSYYIRCYAKKK